MFACDHEGVVPDLIVTAKGIAGGLPLSAVTGRAEIMDAAARRRARRHVRRQPARLRRGPGHDRDDRGRRPGRAGRARSSACMLDRLHRLQADDDRIGDVRGRGAMIAVELRAGPAPTSPTPTSPGPVAAARPPGRRHRADLRHLRQRAPVPAAAGHQRRAARPRGSTSSPPPSRSPLMIHRHLHRRPVAGRLRRRRSTSSTPPRLSRSAPVSNGGAADATAAVDAAAAALVTWRTWRRGSAPRSCARRSS